MKKKILITAISVLLIGSASRAQLWIGVGGGFGMPLASQTFGSNEDQNSSSDKYELVKGSYGSGLNLGLQAGFMLSDNVGLELGISYLMGTKYTWHNYNDPNSNVSTHQDYDAAAKMLRIMPGIRFTCGDGDLKPYIHGNVVLGMSGTITENYTQVDKNPINTTTTETTEEYTKGMALGFGGGLGVGYHSGSLMIFGEIAMIAQTWAPGHSEYTKYTVNGQDQLPNMTTDQKQTDYVDSYTDTGSSNTGAPSQAIKWYLPFSSWGINVGVAIVLGGK